MCDRADVNCAKSCRSLGDVIYLIAAAPNEFAIFATPGSKAPHNNGGETYLSICERFFQRGVKMQQ